MTLLDLYEELGPRRAIGNVMTVVPASAADRFCNRHSLIFPDVGNNHRCAFPGQQAGMGFALPAPRASGEDYLFPNPALPSHAYAPGKSPYLLPQPFLLVAVLAGQNH